MTQNALHLFEGFGVELEYMIVDAQTLDVRPICDEALKAVAGRIVDNVDRPGGLTWSNELVLHVLELKGTQPFPELAGRADLFQRNIRAVNEVLETFGARLLPSAMHPWMDPRREMVLWPHEYHAVYETFHRIFDCRGHGWANLQSVHLNLPFCGDDEFGQLHAAIRVLLPLLPALAASSPVFEDRLTGLMDNRLEFYRLNSAAIPSIAGQVIPESVFARSDYEETILKRIYKDVAPHDREGILQNEFLNARGAIARFSRGAIEIRILDVQECPAADLAICAFIVEVLKFLLSREKNAPEKLRSFETEKLADVFRRAIREADQVQVEDAEYLSLWGLDGRRSASIAEIWRHLYRVCPPALEHRAPLELILEEGPLARRIVSALGPHPGRETFRAIYRRLAECLERGHLFLEK